MWSEDPSKARLVDDQVVFVEPEEVAEAMYQLVIDPDLGNGTILECKKDSTRIVPEYYMSPPTAEGGGAIPSFMAEMAEYYHMLRRGDMKL